MARILVVDDNIEIRRALALVLEGEGHEIIQAEDGDQVFDIVVAESPDLVLLDAMMPRKDGFEALASLKADRRTCNIPVIVVTAKGRPEDLARARSLGAVGCITKPWADGDIERRAAWALDSASEWRGGQP